MATIVIENIFQKKLEVHDLATPLLRHFHNNGVDWMHSCGGKGRCTTCKVIVKSGAANFSGFTPAEKNYQALGALKKGERLSCQVRISGDVTVSVPDEYKLPHVTYSDDQGQ